MFTVKLTDTEHEVLHTLASIEERNRSDLVRKLIREEAKRKGITVLYEPDKRRGGVRTRKAA